MKKVLALATVTMLSLTLAACGNSGKKASEPETAAEKSSEARTETERVTEAPETEAETAANAGSADLQQDENGLYMICTAEDLVAYRALLEEEMQKDHEEVGYGGNGTSGAILMADIDMSSVCGPETGSWRAIGKGCITAEGKEPGNGSFQGIFNGNGHTISNLYIDETESGGALFGIIWEAEISDLTISDSQISCATGGAGMYAGAAALAMTMQDGKVTNCSVTESVSITGTDYVGGLVSFATEWNSKAVFENCTNAAAITGKQGVGGIVGLSEEAVDLLGCVNRGAVTGEDRVGGIIGKAGGDSYYHGNITGCINYGTVTRSAGAQEGDYLAGIAGANGSSIDCCVNAGAIDGGGFEAYDITNTNDYGHMDYCINTGTVNSCDDPEYSIITMEKGYSFEPGAPELTDGSLVASLNETMGKEYWIQGEEFPVWSGLPMNAD